jgi:hypothetical protein
MHIQSKFREVLWQHLLETLRLFQMLERKYYIASIPNQLNPDLEMLPA